MVIYLGDVHGFLEAFEVMIDRHLVSPGDAVIQVGDMGVSDFLLDYWNRKFPQGYVCPVYFIEGNHENFSIIDKWPQDKVSEVANGLYFVPRGIVMELEGKLHGFLGGASSVDRAYRPIDHREHVSLSDVQRFIDNVAGRELDVLVSHAPPSSAINALFPPLNRRSWGLPKDWEDQSGRNLDVVRVAVKCKQWVCGHMHASKSHENVRILNINEAWAIKYE